MIREIYFLCEKDGLDGELSIGTFVNKELCDHWLSCCNHRWPNREFYISKRDIVLSPPTVVDMEIV